MRALFLQMLEIEKKTNIPELSKFKNNKRVFFEFGVGGNNKKNSSISILQNYKN